MLIVLSKSKKYLVFSSHKNSPNLSPISRTDKMGVLHCQFLINISLKDNNWQLHQHCRNYLISRKNLLLTKPKHRIIPICCWVGIRPECNALVQILQHRASISGGMPAMRRRSREASKWRTVTTFAWVTSRLHIHSSVEIARFFCHLDFTWNQSRNSQTTVFWPF